MEHLQEKLMQELFVLWYLEIVSSTMDYDGGCLEQEIEFGKSMAMNCTKCMTQKRISCF